ncbi:MAG: restriction endonuclease [Candidatus Accumulibacter sp. UW25]|jgi:restriction system protein
MTIPTYDKFIEPVLRYLVQHPEGVPAKQAHDAAATALKLTDEERQELLASGAQVIYKNRAGWAQDRLKRAGLSVSPKRGLWKPTAAGIAFAADNKAPFSTELAQKLAIGFMKGKAKPNANTGIQYAIDLPQKSLPVAAVASPDDQLGHAVTELRQSAATELLEVLGSVSPSFFETIVLELLHRMGYGANRNDLQQVGGSGDAGIDGIISLDRLGLEKVYVQAKRWKEAISRPHLQAFYGALAGQKAKKGVFITTSCFSAQARDFVKSVEGIVLIDGERLAELMIDYEVGISVRTVKIPKVDTDYFDEEIT